MKSLALLLILAGFAQNPAGPRGGTEPILTPPPPRAAPPPTMPPSRKPQPPSAPPPSSSPAEPAAPSATPPAAAPVQNPTITADTAGDNNFGVYLGLNFPHFLTYGLDFRHASRLFGISLGGGSFDAKIDDVRGRMSNQEILMRWFPQRKAFFVGLAFGRHEMSATNEEVIQGQRINVGTDIEATYWAPHVGWHWETTFGLTYGFEVGYLFPANEKVELNPGTTDPAILNDPDYIAAREDAKDEAEKIAGSNVPYVTLIRIGYQF